MIEAVLSLDLPTTIFVVYGLLFAVPMLRKAMNREWSFYSPTPPFVFIWDRWGKTYTARENPPTGRDKFDLIFAHYVIVLGSVAVGVGCLIYVLSGRVADLISVPTWLISAVGPGSARVATIVFILVVTSLISAACLLIAVLTVRKVWRHLYTPLDTPLDPEAEREREWAAERRDRRVAIIPPYEEQRRLEAKRNEHERWKIDGLEQLKRLGLAGVLDEPELPMSRYYVTGDFTEYGDPLAPFREKFAPLTDVNLRDLLDQEDALQDDPDKTIDVEVSDDTSEPESDLPELPPPATPVQPRPRLEALDGVREEAGVSPVEDASPTSGSELPKIEGHIAEHLWDKLRTGWYDVIDSPVAKVQGGKKPYRGRFVPEQLVLSEVLLEAVLGGRPAGLKSWRYKGQTVDGMLALDLETAALYPELQTWLQDPGSRAWLVNLETDRDKLETLSHFLTTSDVTGGDRSLGGWRPPTLALTERAWIHSIGYVPVGEKTTTRNIKKPLVKVELPVEW